MARPKFETTRISATIPLHHEQALERLAERERVSVAHVVRRAIERAITEAEGGLLANLGPASPAAHANGRKRQDAA